MAVIERATSPARSRLAELHELLGEPAVLFGLQVTEGASEGEPVPRRRALDHFPEPLLRFVFVDEPRVHQLHEGRGLHRRAVGPEVATQLLLVGLERRVQMQRRGADLRLVVIEQPPRQPKHVVAVLVLEQRQRTQHDLARRVIQNQRRQEVGLAVLLEQVERGDHLVVVLGAER